MAPEEATAIWTRRLAIVTAVIGIITAIFSGLQWKDIRNNADETKLALKAAQSQADAAIIQAQSSNIIAQNAQAQTDAIAAQQRSYVGLSDSSVDYFVEGKRAKSIVMLRNYGLPAEVYSYSFSRTYTSENFHQTLSDDAVQFVDDCKASTLVKDSMAKRHTLFLGVVFPTESRPIIKDSDEVVDNELLSGQKTFVRIDCVMYRVGNDLKHTLSCFDVKPPLPPSIPPPPGAPPGLVAHPRMFNCDAASFAE